MENRRARFEVEKAILSILGLTGLMLVALTAPNALRALKPYLSKRGKWRDQSVYKALTRLKEERLIEFRSKNGKDVLEITENGRKRHRQFKFEEMRLEVPAGWKRGWTVIIFDIPEEKKTARDALRRKLRQLGCYQYHKSVFVHPSDCGDEIDFISGLFQIEKYVEHFRTLTLGSGEHRAYRYFAI